MMLSLSGKEQTLHEVWQWYDEINSTLNDRKLSVKKALLSGVPVPEMFVGMTGSEIDSHFRFLQSELEYSVCLSMIAATEAAFFVDYWERVGSKRKDSFSKMLKRSYQHVSRPQFDKLLKKWRVTFNFCSKEISEFKNLLNYRHWLAHGRYWILNAGRAAYPPSLVFSSIENMMDCLSNQTKVYWK